MIPIINKLPITRLKLSIARILFHLVKPFYGTQKRIIKRNGINFEVDITEGLDLSLFLFGNFQKHVTENEYLDLPEDAVIFDVGANVGIMSLHFAKKAPKGKVYAFEPTHFAWQKLKRNLELNQDIAQNIQTVQTFVSSEEKKQGEIRAYSSWKINKEIGSDQHPVHGGKVMSTEGVPSTTLDNFVKEQNIARLDFIKIDTDGHEFDVLLGAGKSIKKFKPQLIFELGQYVMEERSISFMDYEDFFSGLGYVLSNAANNKLITNANYEKMVPGKGTIDVLALPG
ncbi:MAG: FkbM family methyltransferase [Cyclobacteriaceae bacterium]|nr:FkbM family methyltransferase [Cyclobacteriaceae bacterium]MCK5278440.1 FkbM family methyltransferase [Cyclobacteriaceae bacterium]MCK5467395.1 FkbM family methyltransferase [Cyclobacteriaceae bacterium]